MKDITYIIFVLAAFFCYTNASDLITCPQSDQSFHPHPTNCSLFIECNNGVPAVLTCIESLHFDEKHGYCNFPEEANCKAEQLNDDENLLTCPESGQSFHPHPKNCSLFIECNSGVSEVLVCIEGLYFDPVRGYCNFPEEANCTTENLFPCPESGQSFYPHPNNCSLFIECNAGMSEVLACIEGLHFDPNRGYCNFPEEANCTAEESNEEDDEYLMTCPESGQSFHPHPKNCSLFIECNHGESEVLACIDGLQFDPVREYCNFPEEASCIPQLSHGGNKDRYKSLINRLNSTTSRGNSPKRHERDIKSEQGNMPINNKCIDNEW